LGEGGFGKVILVKKKPSDGCDQRFAIMVLKKSHIMSFGCVTYTVTEKKALVLASGHPFIKTLYPTVLMLRNKGNFQFFEPASYFQRIINTEIYHQFENVMCRYICKMQKWIMIFIRSGWLSVCVEQLSSHWTHFH